MKRVCVCVGGRREGEITAVPVMHTLSDTCCSKECWVRKSSASLPAPCFAACVCDEWNDGAFTISSGVTLSKVEMKY